MLSASQAPPSTRRLFAARGPAIADHLDAFGPLPPRANASGLVDLLDRAGLTGRGGAGFPAARKLRGVADRGGGVVVANGSEGEPWSDKDRMLLSAAPHLVLDGLRLVADAVGAREAYVVTARPEVAASLRRHVAARDDRLAVAVALNDDRFVAGEESSVVNLLDGRPAVPSDRSVRVYERGVHRRPTLVHNVETLAHVALLARFGAEWFRSLGTADEPGTFLATVGGAVHAPGVLEVAHGTPLPELLATTGGATAPVQAVLVGGFHGAWVPGADVGSTLLSRSSLAAHGASVGAGVVSVLAEDRCGLVESARIAAYLAGEVAGQCGPCVNGLPRMADTLRRLASGERDPRLVPEVERLRRLVEGRGACAHPAGTARFVASSTRVFAEEISLHLGGGCSAPAAR